MTRIAGDDDRGLAVSHVGHCGVTSRDDTGKATLDSLSVNALSLLRFVVNSLFPGRIALVSSFGADSAVLLNMIAQVDKAAPVVFVDTGQHFSETLAYRDALCARLGLTNIVNAVPDAATLQEEDPEKGLFASNLDRCCEIRKVRPLAKTLEGYKAWITGRKRFQNPTRAALRLMETEGDRIKINPLYGWTATDILDYIRDSDLPPHPLVAKGYASIGCVPCTTSVKPGENPRAGRWRGRMKTECGIHLGSLETPLLGMPQIGPTAPPRN